MRIEDVLKLIEAGYTKDEINAFESAPVEPAPVEPAPVEPAQAEPAPTEEPEVKKNSLESLIGRLENTIKEMQSDNLKHAEQGEPTTLTAESVSEEFLKNL